MDLAIVLLSVMGITLEEIEISAALPINPTIIRIMRVLRIARGTSHTHTHVHTNLTHVLNSYKSDNVEISPLNLWTTFTHQSHCCKA